MPAVWRQSLAWPSLKRIFAGRGVSRGLPRTHGACMLAGYDGGNVADPREKRRFQSDSAEVIVVKLP